MFELWPLSSKGSYPAYAAQLKQISWSKSADGTVLLASSISSVLTTWAARTDADAA